MVTVYSAPDTRAMRVIWLLEEIGVKAEIKSMPYPPRKHAPDYFAVNPTGMVPLLIDGEVRLTESMAICDYLATKHGSPLVVPPNNPERPQFLQWLWYGVDAGDAIVASEHHAPGRALGRGQGAPRSTPSSLARATVLPSGSRCLTSVSRAATSSSRGG
jgi:glutathione S-transferase